jgi:hypothetical protein
MREQATWATFTTFYQMLLLTLLLPHSTTLSSSLLGSDLHICAQQSTPFELYEVRSLLHAFRRLSEVT